MRRKPTTSDRHEQFHRELRESFMQPCFFAGLTIGVACLIAGGVGLIETAIFPWDALSIISLSILALILKSMGYISQANHWFIIGLLWAINFNVPFYGTNHPITALWLPVIVVSGMLIGRIFLTIIVAQSVLFIVLFATAEYTGRNEALYAISAGDLHMLAGSILFWVSLMVATGWLVRIFAAQLEHAVATARGQTITLSKISSLLNDDFDVEQVFEQVTLATSEQLEAADSTLFLHNEIHGTPIAEVYYAGGKIKHRTHFSDPVPVERVEDILLWQEINTQKRPILITDLANDFRLRHRVGLLTRGIRTVLIIPVMMDDRVIGLLLLNSHERRAYLPEEIELAQALVTQISLAIQLSRLTEANRETAIIRERNRMAREIHDTLAQGFTGVIVQLEAAEDVLEDDPGGASQHIYKARQLARDSLREARQSVMALRPQSLEDKTLPEAIQHIIDAIATPHAPRIQFEQIGYFRSLMPMQAHHLLRITQESLTNALKYAAANTIHVRLCYDKDHVTVSIEDDGCGFVVEDVSSGFGLIGMRERVELMNAHLVLNSQPGKGTQVSVRVSYV